MEKRDPDTIEPPENLSLRHVCYWYEKMGKGKLIGTQGIKARQIVTYELIEPQPLGKFKINPLPRNKRVHIVDMNKETCSCQASTRIGIECSHIKAVKIYLFRKNYNEKTDTI